MKKYSVDTNQKERNAHENLNNGTYFCSLNPVDPRISWVVLPTSAREVF